ncbi:MAG TPA: molybdate ABC transporter substrate-binding protein [Terriglobia bacterium]|nr:molybdate ABC transporter substrate-binding protein [Terriglobia bacterium]
MASRKIRGSRPCMLALCLAILAGGVFSNCLPAEPSKQSVELIISAAISLTESLQAIRNLYRAQVPDVSIVLNLGASGILQQQVEQGAPADIYISASPEEMNSLETEGLLLNQTRRNLLENTLVLICPAASKKVSGFQDLMHADVQRIAMASPESVPAGVYAEQTLKYLKIYQQVRPKIILAQDVRQALAYVETDNADAGLVYATEAKLTNKVRVVARAPRNSHAPIVYPVAVLKRCPHVKAAERFVDFLASPAAQRIFAKEGFARAGQ